MTQILDQRHDAGGAELYRIAQLYPMPDYVKRASSADLYPDSPPPAALAYREQKMLPCHNPASTWLSAAFFHEKRAHYAPSVAAKVEARLKAAAVQWGIAPDVEAIGRRAAELHDDSKLPDSAFAYVKAAGDGTTERAFRVTSAMEVKVAAQYLKDNRHAVPYADRRDIATRLLEKAGEYGAGLGRELDDFLDCQAGRGFCNPADAVAMIRQRETLTKSAGEKAVLAGIAAAVGASPGVYLQPDSAVKLAEAMYAVDGALKLVGRYTAEIRPPEDVLFAYSFDNAKEAAANDVCLTTGNAYDRADFEKLSLHDLQSVFGSDFAEAVAEGLEVSVDKLAAVAGTLPRSDAADLEALLREKDAAPVYKAAADSEINVALRKFAAKY